MPVSKVQLPYFDLLLNLLDCGHPDIDLAFGRHVHWGYWPNPNRADHSAADFRQAAEQLTREIYAATDLNPGQSVLDVGCGFGGTIASLNEQFSNLRLAGLNIDPRQLERAQRSIQVQKGNTLQLVEGSASYLPFPDQSFDVVLAVECIFHFPDRHQFFQEAYRVLKPGGKLALSDFVPVNWIKPLVDYATQPEPHTNFYGQCDSRFTAMDYECLATAIGLKTRCARNITSHTLPTYDFLWTLKNTVKDTSAFSATFILEWMSRLGLMKYMIFAFEKPEVQTHPLPLSEQSLP